ncbi:YqcC family protein [Shewanella salipaludis]|uniref:YqcC family protein n=1 Tax=Shewanella salipaludis TaxID=2723052 RepID=A0A972FZT2_9GAMM|nr:YqcC family protein [Shewanella salipaludis]NMH64574.1 YqcC family protein [Shewanella salipaludis]
MHYAQTLALLGDIEAELKALEFWSEVRPSAAAMASTAPFCCDLMPMEHWLQFIFLPRMHRLIEMEQPLPTKIAIAPMGKHVWAGLASHKALIGILNDLDVLLNEPS